MTNILSSSYARGCRCFIPGLAWMSLYCLWVFLLFFQSCSWIVLYCSGLGLPFSVLSLVVPVLSLAVPGLRLALLVYDWLSLSYGSQSVHRVFLAVSWLLLATLNVLIFLFWSVPGCPCLSLVVHVCFGRPGSSVLCLAVSVLSLCLV